MTILATIVVLGVLIFVHELGHFLAAKSVGIEVQRFSIGLGPTIFGFQKGETEYVISWIPLGGYVKMGGMDDEVMDRLEGGAAAELRKPSPSDFDSKPIWARTFVLSAGVFMNMLFAFGVYVGVNAVWGLAEMAEQRIARVEARMLPEGTEVLASIPEGASIVRIGDREIGHRGDIRDGLIEAPAGRLEVVTAEPFSSVAIDLGTDPDVRLRLLASLRPWIEPVVGAINPGTPADKGGLEPGDRVLMANGVAITHWYDFVDVIESRPALRTELLLERDGVSLMHFVTPDEVTQEDAFSGETTRVGKVGIYPNMMEAAYQPVSLGRAIRLGWAETVGVSGLILGFLRDLVTGGVSPRSVGSIVTIGAASGQAAQMGLETFLRFMALFSVNLAILNLLPIPVLDGGHLVFLGIEAVRGKALSIEQRLRWSHVGFLVVMGIMLWALSNDILRLFGL